MKTQECANRLASLTSGQLNELLSLIPHNRQTVKLRNALHEAEVALDESFGLRTVDVPLNWSEVSA